MGNGLGTTINEHSLASHNERRRGQRPGHSDQVPSKNNERRRGNGLGAAIENLRRTTSGDVGYDLVPTL